MERRPITFLFFLLLLAGVFFYWKKICFATENPLIRAVQTAGDDSNDDFIEIYNPSCTDLDISGWKIRKRTASGSESSIKALSGNTIIKAKGYFLWSNSDLAEKISADQSTGSILSDNYSLALTDNDKIIDSITWGINSNPFSGSLFYSENLKKSQTLIRNSDDTFFTEINYSPKNSSFINNRELSACPKPEPTTTIEYSDKIQITELLPNPKKDNDEYIEIYNGSDEKINLKNWFLRDASKTGKYTFDSTVLIAPQSYLVIYGDTFKFALNNGGDENVTLYNPKEEETSSVSYKGSKKGISYSFDGTVWHWSKFLTPGKENQLEKITKIKLKIKKEVYLNVSADFKIDGLPKKTKVTWDFGDGHKSYKQKAKHTYEKTGKYEASVKYSEGSEDRIEKFSVEVVKMKHPEVKIIAVNANPKGQDSKKETITIQNKSKKKINLNGWSIATGWKKLTNHPIAADFEIKPKKSREITREISKFTLNNKKSKIELRYPDGEVAHKINYSKKDNSIAEGELYQKNKNNWEWAATETNKTAAPSISALQPAEEISQAETEFSAPASPIEIETRPKESENIIGKFSALANQKQDLENKLLSFKNSKPNSSFTYRLAFLDQGFVLGASAANKNNFYSDTSLLLFLNKYFLKINLLINNFLSKL